MNEYYTLTGLLTQGGAIVGTTLVTAMVGKLGGNKVTAYLKFVAAFLALLFAFLFARLGQTVIDWWALVLLTLVNGAIVFLSAMGGNEMMSSGTGGVVTDMTPERPAPIVESLAEAPATSPAEPVIAAGFRDPASPVAEPKPKFFRSWF
jgi:drug/metabolite transporter (DMT)-like permease